MEHQDRSKATTLKKSRKKIATPTRLAAALAACKLEAPPKPELKQGMLDLFGDVPVTQREIEVWLFKVPKMPFYHRGRTSYILSYDVPRKIARAKLNGEWGSIVGDECCEFCGQELAQNLAPVPVNAWPDRAALQEEMKRLKRRVIVLELLLRQPTTKEKSSSHASRGAQPLARAA